MSTTRAGLPPALTVSISHCGCTFICLLSGARHGPSWTPADSVTQCHYVYAVCDAQKAWIIGDCCGCEIDNKVLSLGADFFLEVLIFLYFPWGRFLILLYFFISRALMTPESYSCLVIFIHFLNTHSFTAHFPYLYLIWTPFRMLARILSANIT